MQIFLGHHRQQTQQSKSDIYSVPSNDFASIE